MLRDGRPGSAYRQVLGTGPAVRPFACSVVARLPISMGPLGALLLVQQVRGSYGFAGAVTGAFALGTSAGGPAWARLMGRFGQARVVAATSVTSAVLLALLALATVNGARSGALIGAAAASGLAFPPVGPAMRAAWKVVLPDTPVREAGYALDAVAVECIFVGGPLLLSMMLPLTAPVVPLLVTAALLAAGGLGFSATAAARHTDHRVRPAERVAGGRRPDRSTPVLRTRGLLGVLVVSAAMSVGFGHLDTSMAATARGVLHDQALLGVLFTCIAGGSAVGGLVYGSRRWPSSRPVQLTVLLMVFACGLAPLPFVLAGGHVPLGAIMPFLFLAGLPIAPCLIIPHHLVDGLAAHDRASVGQAWLSSSSTTGSAAGTAVAGVLIDAHGPAWGFAGALTAVALAALVSVSQRGRWHAAA